MRMRLYVHAHHDVCVCFECVMVRVWYECFCVCSCVSTPKPLYCSTCIVASVCPDVRPSVVKKVDLRVSSISRSPSDCMYCRMVVS